MPVGVKNSLYAIFLRGNLCYYDLRFQIIRFYESENKGQVQIALIRFVFISLLLFNIIKWNTNHWLKISGGAQESTDMNKIIK